MINHKFETKGYEGEGAGYGKQIHGTGGERKRHCKHCQNSFSDVS